MRGDTLEGGDTRVKMRVKAIKSDSDSDGDEQKKAARVSGKNRVVTPSVGVSDPSDATANIYRSQRAIRPIPSLESSSFHHQQQEDGSLWKELE